MESWHDDFDEFGCFDPLCVERSAPIDDEEAVLVEAICRAATPGPMVIDDGVEGEAVPVVSLPDGRMIVSLGAAAEHAHDEAVVHANAQLVCKARYLLLRLLRDREQWRQREESLLERVRTLEEALGIESDHGAGEDRDAGRHGVRRPR